MKKPLVRPARAALALVAFALSLSTASAGNPYLGKNAGTAPAAILAKYDANQDGHLDDTELAAWKADRLAAIEQKRAESRKASAAAPAAPTAPAPSPNVTPTKTPPEAK